MHWRPDRGRPEPPGEAFAAARAEMVERQLRARGVTDGRVLAAMGSVPRERFVAPALHARAYADEALPAGLGQTISQPLMVGLMTQLLKADSGMRVLEIGTGTGYQAAILAALGCRVTTLERLPGLAGDARATLESLGFGGHVDVRTGDGTLGDPAGAPWPRILVTAGAPRIPGALVAQLADGGRLVIPVGPRGQQELILVERTGDAMHQGSHGPCVFVPLVGADGWR